jgi:hypothetical protein
MSSNDDKLVVIIYQPELKSYKNRTPFVVFHVALGVGGNLIALIRGWRCIGGYIAPPQVEVKGGKWRATALVSRRVLQDVHKDVSRADWWQQWPDLPPLKEFEVAIEEAELTPRILEGYKEIKGRQSGERKYFD